MNLYPDTIRLATEYFNLMRVQPKGSTQLDELEIDLDDAIISEGLMSIYDAISEIDIDEPLGRLYINFEKRDQLILYVKSRTLHSWNGKMIGKEKEKE